MKKSGNIQSSVVWRLLTVFFACAVFTFASCSDDDASSEPATDGLTAMYTVTVANGMVNGTVVADKVSAAPGDTVTLTVQPKDGCMLEKLFVVADDNSVISLRQNKNDYAFTMPAQNVTVTATFAPISAEDTLGAYTALASGTDGSAGTSAKYVTFGVWPQTIKASGVAVDETDTKTAGIFTYWKGDDGAWYASLQENAWSDGQVYSDGTPVGRYGQKEKYFKVEPIKWRILTENYGGNKLLLAENILAALQYYDYDFYENRIINGSTIYPNNYKHSRIRAWLNGLAYQNRQKSGDCTDFAGKGFLQTAFTTDQQESIAETTVGNSARSTNPESYPLLWNGGKNDYACENTSDKVFLLSEQEVTKSAYGFDHFSAEGASRVRVPSDFAKAAGVVWGQWWIRSPCYTYAKYAQFVNKYGRANENYYFVNATDNYGVVPALCMDN